MITVLERENGPGDHVVRFAGRHEIVVDSKSKDLTTPPRIGFLVGEEALEEFKNALMIAEMIASGKLAVREHPHWVELPCTVPGMACNTKGYVLLEALYRTEDGDICANHHFRPLAEDSEDHDTFLLTRNADGEYTADFYEIVVESLPLKEKDKHPIIVKLI